MIHIKTNTERNVQIFLEDKLIADMKINDETFYKMITKAIDEFYNEEMELYKTNDCER